MKFFTHPVTVAWGFTTLLLLPLVNPLISPPYNVVYHLQGPTSSLMIPVIIYLVVLWAVSAAIFSLIQHTNIARRVIWGGIISFAPWIALKIVSQIVERSVPHLFSLFLFLLCTAAYLALLTLWRSSFQRGFNRAQNLAATMLGFAALSGILIAGHLGWIIWQTRNLNNPLPLHQQAALHRPPHKRILWLILDELSYRQVYEHRFPGLQLPAFDRLASQSTLFTHTLPAGLMTEYVVPSLMTGIKADEMRASTDGRELYLQSPDQSTWQRFDQHNTVFQDALDRGYSTAAVGWYNPYCRLMPQVLDHCIWNYHYPITAEMSAEQPIDRNLKAPIHFFSNLALHFFHLSPSGPHTLLSSSLGRIRDYHALFHDADQMIDDSSIDFLYLHMPVPHPTGIYNRRTAQIATGASTYIDNLALADAYLAHLRSHLEQRGEWDSSTILVMGDHSWRTVLFWNYDPAWTPEEEAASDGGKFDNRPAYILKLPNQQLPAHIDTPFPATQTRTLLDALMDQRIQTPQQLSAWVNAHVDGN